MFHPVAPILSIASIKIGTSGSNTTNAEPFPTIKSMWGTDSFWSSTNHNGTDGYRLLINNDYALVSNFGKGRADPIVCTK